MKTLRFMDVFLIMVVITGVLNCLLIFSKCAKSDRRTKMMYHRFIKLT